MTPSTTPVAAIRTRIVAATATMASIYATNTIQSLAASQTIVADRLTATAIRTQGLSTRTATATALKTATATPMALMQSVIALRGATQTVVVALTGTTSANRNAVATQQQSQRNALTQTAFTKNTATAQQKQFLLSATPFAKQTQTALIATQRSNNSTSTAEIIQHIATRTATPSRTATLSSTRTSTRTITSTHTITSTRTTTGTRTSTVTKTVSPTSVSVIMPTTLATRTLSGNVTQLISNQQYLFALTGNDTASPILETVDLTDFTRQTPFAIDGLSANLMSINQTANNQLVIVGRLTWNTLFVQRLDVSVNPAHETGYWTIVSPATPSALVVSGRYIYIAMTQTVPNSPILQTTLITLANDAWLHELAPRIALPGPVSVMLNSDSGEFGLMIAGTTANNKGYLVAGNIQNGRLIIGTPLTVPSRINQVVSQHQITGLTPQNMLFTSDGVSVIQYQLDIGTQTFLHLSTQPIANIQIVLMTNPTQLLAVSNVAPWQVLLYNVLSQGIIARGTAVIAPDQPTHLMAVRQWLVWSTNNMLYRAHLNR
jgi:hypothetical protein